MSRERPRCLGTCPGFLVDLFVCLPASRERPRPVSGTCAGFPVDLFGLLACVAEALGPDSFSTRFVLQMGLRRSVTGLFGHLCRVSF